MNRLLNLLLILVIIGWNYFTTSLPLNDVTLAELSEKYATLINPAPYAFSIWGLIYLGLIAFAIFQLTPAGRRYSAIDKFSPALWVNLFFNGVWLAFFHFELIWSSLIAMLGVLVSLIYINILINKEEKAVPRWVAWLFQVYFGWITVATVVNFSSCFNSLNSDLLMAFSEQFWFYTLISIATILAFVVLQKFRAFFYSLTIVWAFVAISLDQNDSDFGLFYFPLILAGVILIYSAMAAVRGNGRVIY
ncbi:tryptophan-rich sensory protein [Halocola ammonii]